jgi:hypothetical protein
MENMVSAMGVDATCCGYQIMIEYVSIEFGPTKVQQDDMSGQGFISTNILCISVYRSHETKVVVRTRGVEYQGETAEDFPSATETAAPVGN